MTSEGDMLMKCIENAVELHYLKVYTKDLDKIRDDLKNMRKNDHDVHDKTIRLMGKLSKHHGT